MKTALLVIDYINGIMEGSCAEFASHHPILEKTNQLIAEARKADVPIYFVRLAFDEAYKNIPKHSKMFNYIKDNGLFQLGTKSTEFVKELDYRESDCVINKTSASPFCHTNLMETLRRKGIERIIFSGVATDNAINIGSREASDAGFYTIIVEDACGASSENFHLWSIKMLDKIVNQIVSTNELPTLFHIE